MGQTQLRGKQILDQSITNADLASGSINLGGVPFGASGIFVNQGPNIVVTSVPSGNSLTIDTSGNINATVSGVNVAAHNVRHESGGLDEINVAGLLGRLNDSQFISIQEDGTPASSQVHTINFFTGLTIAGLASNVATVTATSKLMVTKIVKTGTNDGTADYYTGDYTYDEQAIQAAIDAVYALGGGTVFLREGTYNIKASAIHMKSNVTLCGIGNGTILQFSGNLSTDTRVFIDNATVSTNVTGVKIHDMQFNFTKTYNGNPDFFNNGIAMNTCDTWELYELLFTITSGVNGSSNGILQAIYPNNTPRVSIHDCTSVNASTLVNAELVHAVKCPQLKIKNCSTDLKVAFVACSDAGLDSVDIFPTASLTGNLILVQGDGTGPCNNVAISNSHLKLSTGLTYGINFNTTVNTSIANTCSNLRLDHTDSGSGTGTGIIVSANDDSVFIHGCHFYNLGTAVIDNNAGDATFPTRLRDNVGVDGKTMLTDS